MSARVEERGTLDRASDDAPNEAWKVLLRTQDTWLPTILRVGLGAVILPHGIQKAFGLGGAGGFVPTMSFFTDVMHIPAPVAFLVIAIELAGALALIAGFCTRVAAAGVGAVMLGAVAMVHAPHGFFMNWFGNQAGEGYEYFLLALTMVAALVAFGGGKASLDRRLVRDAA